MHVTTRIDFLENAYYVQNLRSRVKQRSIDHRPDGRNHAAGAVVSVTKASAVVLGPTILWALFVCVFSVILTEIFTLLRTCRHIALVLLTFHPGTDSGRLPPINLLYRRSSSPPLENGLFQFPATNSGTVFHHMWHLHRRWRYSDSVLKHFSFACHIRTMVICLVQMWTKRSPITPCYLGQCKNSCDDDDASFCNRWWHLS